MIGSITSANFEEMIKNQIATLGGLLRSFLPVFMGITNSNSIPDEAMQEILLN
ncbi:hypothetical protein [Melghirimyces algeriensis]|nr:hypothetical protein [Melghirimyces algeriensis]